MDRNRIRSLALFILLVVIIAIPLGCGSVEPELVTSDTGEGSEGQTQSGGEGTESQATEEEAAEPNKIGDVVAVGGVELTVNHAYMLEGDEWDSPNNAFFLVLDVTISNTSDEYQSFSTMLQMALYDDESYSLDQSLFTTGRGSLDGQIGPGRRIRGQIVFDVPESEYYEFVFKGDILSSSQTIWCVTRSEVASGDVGVAAMQDDGPFGDAFSLGDSVKFGDLVVTLNSVRISAGSDWSKPENDRFLILDATVENTGKESVGLSSLLQIKLLDGRGYSQTHSLFADTKGSLDGDIGGGRKLRGEIAFDVCDSSYYEFVFQNPFQTGQAIWRFSLGD